MPHDMSLEGWVARDQDGDLYLYLNKPYREQSSYDVGCWTSYGEYSALDNTLFPSVKWESEPLEVIISIRPK